MCRASSHAEYIATAGTLGASASCHLEMTLSSLTHVKHNAYNDFGHSLQVKRVTLRSPCSASNRAKHNANPDSRTLLQMNRVTIKSLRHDVEPQAV